MYLLETKFNQIYFKNFNIHRLTFNFTIGQNRLENRIAILFTYVDFFSYSKNGRKLFCQLCVNIQLIHQNLFHPNLLQPISIESLIS